MLQLVERTLQDDAGASAYSPLELLAPLLAREGETTHAAETGFQIRVFPVAAKATADIRATIRTILIAQATGGRARERALAADSSVTRCARHSVRSAARSPTPR